MRALKPAPKGWPIPKSERCVYEKKVNDGPMTRCRYRNQFGGYCGIHTRMMERRDGIRRVGVLRII